MSITIKELIETLNKYPLNSEIVLAQHTSDDGGELIDSRYCEPLVEPWNVDDEEDGPIVLYPGELISG